MNRLFPLLLLPVAVGCSDYAYREFEFSDVFFQKAADQVDILLVIDDSHSMAPYQEQLGASFDTFLVYFAEAAIDYRIGVTTTDTIADTAGQIQPELVTPTTPDAAAVFERIVNVGTRGTGTEMGLEAARLALGNETVEFLRPEAYLSVIVVSDEEDSSPLSVNEYVNGFRALKGYDRDAFHASAATVFDRDTCPTGQANESTLGTRYIAVAEVTGGVSEDLCSDDFATVVTKLSLNTSRLRDTFYLSGEPKVATLELEMNGEAIGCDAGVWSFALLDVRGEPTPAIVFSEGNLPPLEADIAVYYNLGTAVESEFCTGEDA